MKITNKIEAEILQVMEDYWGSYFNGDLQSWASFLPDDYRNIGTTKAEIWNSKKEIVDFTEKVLDQTAGMAEVRNKKTQIIPYDPYVMVHELGDLFVKAEEGWIFYAHFRLSSLLEKTAGGWKILHQHGSFPDTKADEGEAFGFDELKVENKKLRDAIQSRTIELERKNRELEIEAALERVRAKTMAMHRSDELGTTSLLLFDELKALGEISEQISIGIFDEENQVLNLYATLHGEQWKEASKVDLDEPHAMQKIYSGWREKKKSIRIDLGGEELTAYNRFRSQYSDLKFPDERWVIHCAFFSKGVFSFSTTTPHDERTMHLLERFAQVFDGTYTRFLDLQKAEAQAREAQIEAALERVRSRSLAVNKSDEFHEVVEVVFDKLSELNIPIGSVCIAVFEDGIKDWDVFGTGAGEHGLATVNFKLPYFKTPFMDDVIVARSKNEEGYFSKVYSEAEKNHYYEFTLQNTALKNLPDDVKQIIRESKSYALTTAFSKNSSIMVNEFDGKVLGEGQTEILKRFSRVFEQAYIRFLDLQKAEAQTKEAQIEAALERVRSQSMMMQHSDELNTTSNVFHEQLLLLGLPSEFSYVWLPDEANGTHMFWATWSENQNGTITSRSKSYTYPLDKSEPYTAACFEMWESDEDVFVNRIQPEEVEGFFSTWSELVGEAESLKAKNFPDGLYYAEAYMKYGCFGINIRRPLDGAEQEVLRRFANEFERTYTRFLDLQKAEEQARKIKLVNQENERLLHSILPQPIAEEIRTGRQNVVKRFEEVSILFADIVGFTVLSEKLQPGKVVDILNGLFSKFDDLTDEYGLEKIKTIGDAYMVAAGVPEERADHAFVLFHFALDMLRSLQEYNEDIGSDLNLRIGISSGPVIAGVIGKKKFAYDLWGDSVNTAARMEAYGQPGKIQISPTSYEILKNDFAFEKMPGVHIKGKGVMDVYLWKGEKKS